MAKCVNEPRVFLVAWVGKHSKDQLLEIDPGEEMTLSGEIGKVTPLISTHGRFAIEVILDKCELPGVAEESGSTPDNQKGEEGKPAQKQQKPDECKGWVEMAKNFLRAGKPKKAIMYAEKVLQKNPDSPYAEEARTIRDQARQILNP